MLKSAMVHLPPIISESLDAKHIQEWSEGVPEWKMKERDGRRDRWLEDEIAQWAQNIDKPQ